MNTNSIIIGLILILDLIIEGSNWKTVL